MTGSPTGMTGSPTGMTDSPTSMTGPQIFITPPNIINIKSEIETLSPYPQIRNTPQITFTPAPEKSQPLITYEKLQQIGIAFLAFLIIILSILFLL
jgi:hypothetical protein